MNISPQDIKQKQFRLRFRGFDIDEVDGFLEELTAELETLLKANESLKDEKAALESKLAGYKQTEKGLKGALMSAQKMSEDMKAASDRDAQLKIKEAELEAERILQAARAELARTREEILEIRRIKERFTLKVKGVIEDHLKMIDYEKKRDEKPGA